MTGKQTIFVPFDPTKSQTTSRSDSRLLCQICFKPFDSSQALRDHIGDFQLEAQQLMARLLEAQAHLPLLNSQYRAVSNCIREACDGDNDDGGDDGETDNEEDDDGDDDAGSVDSSLGLEDRAKLQCPYPLCKRKKQFNRRQDLVRHCQLHTQCYESCVFCRSPFRQVRSFLRHQCKAKKRGNDKAKEFYMRERCAQLRRYATERLDQMLASENASHERTRKRGHEAVDGCSEYQSSKAHTATVGGDIDQWFPLENDLLGVPPRSNMHNLMQPAPITSFPHGSATLASSLSNAGLSTSFPFSQMMERSPNPTLGYAPIFEDITITPCYDQPQLFPSNTLNGDYLAVSPLETPNHILQAPAVEHQRRYGHTDSGAGAIPY